ncbi:SDR family oxidoreductase [Sneathiella limimaris]|uniref:SDR family oxidoreductase n=1 Tax=Sneathiella limimaris TaxID=1964213 RepID=UPI00146D8F5A|nr:SDR family oxidoreductase [Sneathiella limimaris]
MTLSGKITWVTGAGTGIGSAGALKLAAAGAHVILSGRRVEPLEDISQKIASAGGSAEILPLDVTDADAVKKAADKIEAAHGKLDILVNSAGLNIPDRSWERVTPDGFDSVISANLNGSFYCCQAVLPLMRKQADGLIINVSSVAGVRPSILTGPAYTAAKHGVVAFSESLNMEEGDHGIRATALCPGEVNTPILDKRPVPPSPEDREKMLQEEDLGETILFLANLPKRVSVGTLVISPSHNRGYVKMKT